MYTSTVKGKLGSVLAFICVVFVALVIGSIGLRFEREQLKMVEWRPYIQQTAEAWDMDAKLIESVVFIESSGDPQAHSHADAKGLMQITDITLREVRDRQKLVGSGVLWDPEYNLHVGTAYLAYLLRRFDEDMFWALSAYNWGPTKMARWLRNNPDASQVDFKGDERIPAEARQYATKVLKYYQRLQARP